ncbi:MAG: Hsp33 family molecular chaperone HslO [Lautropia sp.]|nr:Hsp33 family molecular chaperone HslO [Lautropia sp.]
MDTLIRFGFAQKVRGQIVKLDRSWPPLARHHQRYGERDVPPTVRERLGELSAAGLLLAASLKFDGSLLLQIQGSGPARLFVAECHADSRFRATVKLDDQAAIPHDASFNDLVNPDNRGRFVVTLIPPVSTSGEGTGLDTPYQGIIPFEGDTVAEVLEHYMSLSEQIPTRLWLAADENAVFGLLLQMMPTRGDEGAPDEQESLLTWEQVQTLADTLTRTEMLTLKPEEILRRLFWDTEIRVYDQRVPRFECSCSRDKVGGMLKMLGEEEVRSILDEHQQRIQVNCEFCREPYVFDQAEAMALFDKPSAEDSDKTPASDGRTDTH